MKAPLIHPFFDNTTSTVCYVVYDKEGGSAAIIDSVLDYDPKSGRTSTGHADNVIDFIEEKKFTSVTWN